MNLPVSRDDDDRESAETLPAEPEAPPVPTTGPRATLEERTRMLRDKELEKKVRYVLLTRGVREMDVEDLTQETLWAAYDAADLPGGEGKVRLNYVLGIARNKAAEYHRKGGRSVELDEEADVERVQPTAPVADPVADRDLLGKILEVDVSETLTLYCLARKWMGEKLVDLAEEVNVPYDRLRKRIDELEERLKARAQRLRRPRNLGALFVLLLALGFGGREVSRLAPPLGPDAPGPVALLEPALSTHRAQSDPTDWARVLRGEAFRACMDGKWMECLGGLNAAAELDPAGDRDPIVAAARKDAHDASMAGLKPGGAWHPPAVRPYAPFASR